MAEHTPSAAQGDIDDELRPYRHGYVMAPTGESYVVHRDASSSSSDAPTRSPSSSPSHRSDPRGKRREPGSSQDYHDDDEKQQQQDHRPAQDYYDGHHEYDDWPLFDDDPWEGGTLPDAPDTTVTAAASSPDLDPDTWRAATVSFLQRELRRVTRQRDEAHRRLDKLSAWPSSWPSCSSSGTTRGWRRRRTRRPGARSSKTGKARHARRMTGDERRETRAVCVYTT
ncbi:hypothetical protein HIM_06833 [Hirsutella minnesotensis 3608]|uniref:Uncharacterized protein n=1 Tax=Hirsutella minnesotensis 3608 TaxID=1043627 RepID=A0A0F7ZNG6_9HYPO|nr:hypothetical protein HIM_06833 [Hirsutella minnesotensis 3608]